MFTNILAVVATLTASVAAHGYVDNVTLGGTTYIGYQVPNSIPKLPNQTLTANQPYQDPYYSTPPDRIIRPVQGNGPIQDVSLIDLQCGGYTAGGISGSTPAKLAGGPVAAGSAVSLKWTLWPDSHVGPLVTYMAKCPAAGCSTYVPGTAYVHPPTDTSI